MAGPEDIEVGVNEQMPDLFFIAYPQSRYAKIQSQTAGGLIDNPGKKHGLILKRDEAKWLIDQLQVIVDMAQPTTNRIIIDRGRKHDSE